MAYFSIIFFLIFLIALLYQFDNYQYFLRRISSFILFISIFTFIIIKVNDEMVSSFKYAIIIISVLYSLNTFYRYITLGAVELGYAAKGEIGSQRFGFVYVFDLWILFQSDIKNILFNNLKNIFAFIILLGLLLTFSRSGIISIILSFLFFSYRSILKWIYNPNFKGIIYMFTFIIIISIFGSIIYVKYPVLFEFFNDKLFSYFNKNGTDQIDLDQDSSEGYRLFMLKNVLKYVFYNPITGAGFLGVWILYDDKSGSAHGQFVDVFFRTGFTGLIIYLIILFKILRFSFNNDKGFYWGIIAIIIYGFFHETFKLSQGSFILSFLIGYTANYKKLTFVNT